MKLQRWLVILMLTASVLAVYDPAKPLDPCYDEGLELVVRSEDLGFSAF